MRPTVPGTAGHVNTMKYIYHWNSLWLGAALLFAAPSFVMAQEGASAQAAARDVNEAIAAAKEALDEKNAPPPPEAFEDDPSIGLPTGTPAPDFPIQSHTWNNGVMVPQVKDTLYEYMRNGPAVLVFVPNVWDEFTYEMFETVLGQSRAFRATKTTLLFIAHNTVDQTAEFRASRRVDAEILHDPDGAIFELYNIPIAMDRFPRQRAYVFIDPSKTIAKVDPLWHYLAEYEDLLTTVRQRAAEREGFATYGELAAAHPTNRALQDDWFWVEAVRKDREAAEKKARVLADRQERIAASREKLVAFREERWEKAERIPSATVDQLPDFTIPVVTYDNGTANVTDTTLGELCEEECVILVFAPALDFRYFNKVVLAFDTAQNFMWMNRAQVVVVFPGSQADAIRYREAFRWEAHVKPDTDGSVMEAYSVSFDAAADYPRHNVEFPLWLVGPDRKNVYANPWFHYDLDMEILKEELTQLAVETRRRRGGGGLNVRQAIESAQQESSANK